MSFSASSLDSAFDSELDELLDDSSDDAPLLALRPTGLRLLSRCLDLPEPLPDFLTVALPLSAPGAIEVALVAATFLDFLDGLLLPFSLATNVGRSGVPRSVLVLVRVLDFPFLVSLGVS